MLLAALGAVVVGAVALALRLSPSSGDDTSDVRPGIDPTAAAAATESATLASSVHDSALRKPAPAARPATAGGRTTAEGGAVVTSGASTAETLRRRAERAELRRFQDSLVRAENAVPLAIRATINRYGRAIESRDIGKLKEVYPSMSRGQEERWKGVFSGADSIRASVRVTGIAATPKDAPTSIDAPFTMQMRVVDKETGRATPSRITNHALFMKEGGVWVLKEIR
jgi:hypothetical protein